MKRVFVRALGWTYRHIGTRVFFKFDSEPIHDFFLDFGETMGGTPGVPSIVRSCFRVVYPEMATTVAGIHFQNPIGLSAGFDHEAQLPQIIGSLGFGFESVGTVTNKPYAGNPYPQMKRLVRSRAILVNKGFKSSGIDAVLARLENARFPVPVGISIGRTNTMEHESHADAIRDICEAFIKTKASSVPFSYYELNISCPNLLKDISFYEPARLEELLAAIDAIKLGKPLFIKMPIILSDETVKELIDVIQRHQVAALTFGNLQHDRKNAAFDPSEIKSVENYKGNWAGMPCQSRSDELIAIAYRHTRGMLPIVGCGGIFKAEDAYRKVRHGASLLQLAAGAVFEGPQIAAEIAIGIASLLKKDGFKNISEAVGADISGAEIKNPRP